MELLYVLLGVMFSSTILFLVLFTRERSLKGKLKEKYEKELGDAETSNRSYVNIIQQKKDIISNREKTIYELRNVLKTGRIGYYQDQVKLVSDEDRKEGKPGDVYLVNVHVKEIDRYQNNDSKIELIKVEVTSGFSPDSYSWVKETITRKFSTIKDTSSIVWLELEVDVKKDRRAKLDKIAKK